MFKEKIIVFFITVLFSSTCLAQQNTKVHIITQKSIFDQAPFEACHASTLVMLSDGKVMAAWFGGKHEGSNDVAIWIATKDDDQWTAPLKIATGATDTHIPIACWNPVLFKAKNGTLFLHYKVGPNPREWWAEYKTSTNEGKTWSVAKKLPPGFLGR